MAVGNKPQEVEKSDVLAPKFWIKNDYHLKKKMNT